MMNLPGTHPTAFGEPVAELRPLRLRHQRHQLRLDFFRVRFRRQAEPLRQPRDVRVHDHAGVEVEGVAENDIRRLAPDAGERREFVHGARHFAAEFFHQRNAAGLDVFGLVVEKAGRLDGLLQFHPRRLRIIRRRTVFFEQFPRHQIDAFVRALRGENGGDEQLERIGKIQFAVRRRVSLPERADDFHCAFFFGGGAFAGHDSGKINSRGKCGKYSERRRTQQKARTRTSGP